MPFEMNGHAGDGENAKIFARYNFISNAVQESVKHNDKREHRDLGEDRPRSDA